MDTASKLDLIRQSMAGELGKPVYEAIQEGGAQTQSPEGNMPSPEMPETPVAPPASPSFSTQIYDKKGELVTPSTSGVGLNQTMGSKSGSMIQPGQYEDGGIKDWLLSKAREIKTSLHSDASPNAKKAIREEKESFDNPREGDPQWYGTTGGSMDAFRHSYATALNVKEHGLKGIIAPMGHEFEALINPEKRAAYAKDIKDGKPVTSILKESYQDIYNNLVGAYIGYTSDSDEEARKRIVEKIKDKDLLFNDEEYIKKNIHPFKDKKNHGGLRKKFKSGGRPTGKKSITELQKHLTSEGYDVGKAGSDGIWGKDTQAAYDKYTARANNKGITGYMAGPVKVSQSTQSYFQYLANAALQHYGFVGDKESFFDVDEDDLRRDELTTYKSMLRTNLDNKKKGKIDYRDYSDDPNITKAPSSSAALEKLKGKGITNILVKDALPFQGQGATKEALHALTGNASYTYDSETGTVHVQDNYDFNKSQREVKKTGASLSDIYNQITKGKYDNLWSNAHSAGDHIKSRMPVDINLGSATDLGLTPEEMRSLRKYNPTASGVTKVNMLDMAKNKIMSYFD